MSRKDHLLILNFRSKASFEKALRNLPGIQHITLSDRSFATPIVNGIILNVFGRAKTKNLTNIRISSGFHKQWVEFSVVSFEIIPEGELMDELNERR